jgi:hypothetical protein
VEEDAVEHVQTVSANITDNSYFSLYAEKCLQPPVTIQAHSCMFRFQANQVPLSYYWALLCTAGLILVEAKRKQAWQQSS